MVEITRKRNSSRRTRRKNNIRNNKKSIKRVKYGSYVKIIRKNIEVINLKLRKDYLRKINREYARYNFYIQSINTLYVCLNTFTKKLKYENKNIFDRFIIDIINDSVKDKIDSDSVLFNSNLKDGDIVKISLFDKMLNEYIEKKMLLPANTIAMRYAKSKLLIQISNIFKSIETEFFRTDIPDTYNCNLEIRTNYVYIKYNDYIRIISRSRYDNILNRIMYNTKKKNPYPDMVLMTMRYAMFENSGQQWSIGSNDVYPYIGNKLNINLEMFASPFNVLLPKFCSLFYDTDKSTGSIGNFFNLTTEKLIQHRINGAIYNPPYTENFINKTSKILMDFLDEFKKRGKTFNILCLLPNWKNTEYINTLTQSEYLIYDVVLQKGEYMNQEKDINHAFIQRGFETRYIRLNSMTPSYDSDMIYFENKKDKDIVEFIKLDSVINKKNTRLVVKQYEKNE